MPSSTATASLPPLTAERLRPRCEPELFSFETTAELEPLDGFMGQDRALEAVEFGTAIERSGFNLFVMGAPGTGRHTAIEAYLNRLAGSRPAPDDWVYVNDFELAQRPRALRLPTGRAIALRDGMATVIEDLLGSLPGVFESDEYRRRRRAIDEEFEEAQEEAFEGLRKEAAERDVALLRTPMGFALAPMRDGQVVKPEAFNAWPEGERTAAQAAISELQESLRAVLERIPRLDKKRREQLRELNREFAAVAVDHALEDLRTTFADLPDIVQFIDAVRADLVENAGMLLPSGGEEEAQQKRADAPELRRYKVNVIVSNGHESTGAPVVREDNPTLPNLVGRIEHLQQMGALVTDFLLIKGGALHRANGGYLLLDARRILTEPLAWEALKRALRNGRIVIESLAEHLSLLSTVSLEPEAIPFSAKVVLFGDRMVYHLLCQLDPEFQEIFKVAVDFDEEVTRSEASAQHYARLISGLVEREALLPFDRNGVARLLEHASRLAEDAERFSVRLGPIADLAREADHWARAESASTISDHHVVRAEQAAIRRLDRLRDKSREATLRNILLVDTEGTRVGQVNGLSVISLGRIAFGRPSRITARVRLGSGKLVDIERETELGGPLHSKGVLILSGLLTARYARDWPVSLAASLVFEQSYGGVEGDSASTAELCALLSAIAEVPLRQDLAITGSINQYGQIQAIGGVNEKIEGFFELCDARGLSGTQGVIIPQANVQHLMLREEVVEACAAGRFAVYAAEHLDQVMELMTGHPAGERGEDGLFPPDSVNRLVEDRLIAMAQRRLEFGKQGEKNDGGSVS
ncbi:Lon protease family protein [Aquibaculum sediminis]|uniref:Lon protease family protein n=1 Tax=Aquibaculum sediminis TaxID=3231907 RepID=UPI00345329A8